MFLLFAQAVWVRRPLPGALMSEVTLKLTSCLNGSPSDFELLEDTVLSYLSVFIPGSVWHMRSYLINNYMLAGFNQPFSMKDLG